MLTIRHGEWPVAIGATTVAYLYFVFVRWLRGKSTRSPNGWTRSPAAYVVVYAAPCIAVSAWTYPSAGFVQRFGLDPLSLTINALYFPIQLLFDFGDPIEVLVAVVLLAAMAAFAIRPRWWTGVLSFLGVGGWVFVGQLLVVL